MTRKQTIVVKLGGSLLETLPASFFEQCATLQQGGAQVVLVHGGGARINDYMERLALKAEFVDGLRVTDASVLELVEMVLGGSVNKTIVSGLEQAGCEAIGLSGIDRGLIQVRQQDPKLGFVGAIQRVKTEVLTDLCALGWIPVIASLGVDHKGQHYNINADTVAGAVALALKADQLMIATDVPGILVEKEGAVESIHCVTPQQIEQLIAEGIIHGGMIPKVRAVCATVMEGVKTVSIVDGRAADVLAKAAGVCEGDLPGTKIVQEGSASDGTHGDVHALANCSS